MYVQAVRQRKDTSPQPFHRATAETPASAMGPSIRSKDVQCPSTKRYRDTVDEGPEGARTILQILPDE